MKTNIGRVKEINNEWVKSLIYGNSDVRTGEQYLPYGIDSKPIKDAISLYIQTDDSTEAVHVGYLSQSDKTKTGELRLFATDSNGVEKFSVYFKDNGECEFGGKNDNLVRYSDLETAFNELNDKYNLLISKLILWMPAPGDGGSALKTLLTTSPAISESNAVISLCKIRDIKTFSKLEEL